MSTPSKRKHPTITLDLAEETEATLMDVVDFYDSRFNIGLSAKEKSDLVAFLKAL